VEPERLVVGRVAKAHGIRGEVAIDVLSDAPDRFTEGARLYAGDRELIIGTSREHQGRMLVRFEGIEDRTEAELLRDEELTIPSTEARALEDWSFYPHQLIDAEVVDTEGRTLGRMKRIDESPGADLWVVTTNGSEVLVPAVREIVRDVDVVAHRITLDPPEGLF